MFSFVYENIDFAHKLDKASLPTENYAKHLHYFNEILYLVEGDLQYTIESETRQLKAGDLVLIQPGKYHFATVNSKLPYERYVLKFPEFPDALLPKYVKEKIRTQGPFFTNAKKFSVLFNQFDSYYGNYSDEELKTLFMCDTVKLLIMLCQEPTYTQRQANGIIFELVNYIDENLHNTITLDVLSKAFSFSKSYISNEFRKYMKIPIMQYVRAKKIIAAHQMILSGEKKTTVAEQFGFEDYSTFYRSYVKVMGFAPNGTDHTEKIILEK